MPVHPARPRPQRRNVLRRILGAHAAAVTVVDVGARGFAPGNLVYRSLLRHQLCRVIGFEADAEECARLNERYGPRHRFLPCALFDGGRHLFHRTNSGATSSLYHPDLALMSQFENLAELCEVQSSTPIDTQRLDDAVAEDVDYLKADVQGAELILLQNGTRVLSQAVAVQVKVEFQPIYRQQPLFGDLERFLGAQGFWLKDIVDPGYRRLKCISAGGSFSSRKLCAAALICHEVLAAPELARRALELHDRRHDTGFAGQYRARRA